MSKVNKIILAVLILLLIASMAALIYVKANPHVLDPAVRGNASIGHGRNADPGPGELQPTELTRPTREPTRPIKPTELTQPSNEEECERLLAAVAHLEEIPPAPPLPVVQDSHGSAGEENGPFWMPGSCSHAISL